MSNPWNQNIGNEHQTTIPMNKPPPRPDRNATAAGPMHIQKQPSASSYPNTSKSEYEQAYTIKNPAPPMSPFPDVGKREDRFVATTVYNDIWAALLFLAALAAFIVLSSFGISTASSTVDGGVFMITGIAFLSAFGLSAVYFMMMQKMAGRLIKAQAVLYVLMTLFMATLCFFQGAWIWGIITLIGSLLFAWMLYTRRGHIPFAKVMLETVTQVIRAYPALISTGIIAMLSVSTFTAFWISALFGLTIRLTTDTYTLYALTITMLFLFYWITEVIRNTAHVTCAGTFATYYFCGSQSSGSASVVIVNVKNPTLRSAKRALTTSFGSICYGSLIIAILSTIKNLINNFASQAQANGNCFLGFLAMIASCVVGMLEWIMTYFNHYAFTQVAIYGKDYCTASKATMDLVKSRGVDAIINDDFIGIVLTMGGLMIGLLTGLISVILCLILRINILAWSACLMGMGIGYMEFSILSQVITSGTATTFVCLAEDPAALQRTQPDLFAKIREVYPDKNFCSQ